MSHTEPALGRALAATIELGDLLHDYHLNLVLVAGASDNAAARRVQWVHSSELADPTPFLTPRTVLLTTGARFAENSDQEEADAYVSRLIDAGVSALGIAVGLHWDRVPLILIRACDRLSLPLFRVPYATSFIAIVQTAARLLNQSANARDAWLLESQRIVANASLHRNGIGSVVREAAARLGRWVAITDRTGRITEFSPSSVRTEDINELVRTEAQRMLSRGVRAGRIDASSEPLASDTTFSTGLQLRALGRSRQTLGVLAVEDQGIPDHAERTLVGLVEALATVQLEHRSGLGAAESALRSAVVELLVEGEIDRAERVAETLLTRVPNDPIVVLHYREPGVTAFADDVQSLDAARPGLLRATRETGEVIIAEAHHLQSLRDIFQRHRIGAGVSSRGRMSSLGNLIDQAALALAQADDRPVTFRAGEHAGLLELLRGEPDARWRADALLAPVREHDLRHSDALETSLRIWLTHHGALSPAAAELGIHRHTLRTRVAAAARLLRRDLDSPDARAELWAALRLAEAPARTSHEHSDH